MIQQINGMGYGIPVGKYGNINIDIAQSPLFKDKIREGIEKIESSTGIDFGDIFSKKTDSTATETAQKAEGWLNENKNLVLTVVGVVGAYLLLRKN